MSGNQRWQNQQGQNRGPYQQGHNRGRSDQSQNRGPNQQGQNRGRNQQGQNRQQNNSIKILNQPGSVLNEEVTGYEDDTFSINPEDALQSLKLSTDATQPRRPDFGTQGASVILFANYFELTLAKLLSFHRYSVDVTECAEEQKPKGLKLQRLIQLLLTEQMSNQAVASDYKSLIISSNKLFEGQESRFSVVYKNEENQQDPNARTYTFLVQYNTTLNPDDLLQYLKSSRLNELEASPKQDIIQAMNIIMSHGLKGNSKIMSQAQKYISWDLNTKESATLGSGIDILRGYFFSIRSATGRILLNAQVKHAAVYRPQPLEALYQNLGIRPNSEESFLRSVEHRIRGLKVKLNHFQPSRNKKILGFAHPGDGNRNHPPQVPFTGAPADKVRFWVEKDKGNGEYITVADHFRRQYNLESNLPVVNTGTRNDPVYTIAEVCTIPSGTPFERRLDAHQSANMIKFAVRDPLPNAKSITEQGFGMVETNSVETLRAFGWDVGKQLIQVKGRVLQSPQVLYAKKTAKTNDGRWNLLDVTLTDSKKFPYWSMLYINLGGSSDTLASGVDRTTLNEYVKQKFTQSVRQILGQRVSQLDLTSTYLTGSRVDLTDVGGEIQGLERIRTVFESAASMIKAGNSKAPRLFLVLLPNTNSTIYNAVKRAGDIDYGIHTVCAQIHKFYKSDPRSLPRQHFQNIGLKINLKLGGRNHELDAKGLDFVAEGKTMIVGLDVTHPAPGEDKAPSIACIVASVNGDCAQWPAYVHIRPRRKEIVEESLEDMLINRLCYWREKNRVLPEQILIYRDGVGEGQYKLVLDHELPKIREACKKTYPATETKQGLPRVTIVVVGKRHNTRFYPTRTQDADSVGNIKNGTIVDRGVTEARIWDFYLAAHKAIKGTTRPAHYVVLHDEIFRLRAKPPKAPGTHGQRAANLLESITHNLCYLYGRATLAVSICPPAYYADIGCERARRWMSRFYSDYAPGTEAILDPQALEVRVHERLRNTMYYI